MSECELSLTQQKQRTEDRLEKMYVDKLDGVISEEEYTRIKQKIQERLDRFKVQGETARRK